MSLETSGWHLRLSNVHLLPHVLFFLYVFETGSHYGLPAGFELAV